MTLSLLLGVHAHQPVGNFETVIDEAHGRCYAPFLRILHRFPEFQFSAHFSGWLLDYLLKRFPADMELLADMSRRGQVELFGAGDCEPVLAAIPARDRRSQLDAMADRLERHFGQRPKGAWLTERVWEATVVPTLADSGIRYVAVDDYHFLCSGTSARNLDGYHSTEEDGRRLDAFPISESLRYRLPFSRASEAVAYLEQLADEGSAAAVYFDDIEKFGIWPDTYDWVYTQGWLEQFICGVLASPKVTTATYARFHADNCSHGIVYLPTASYIEMNEWTLPAHAANEYARLVDQEKQSGRYEQSKAHVRGGIWRNFFSRYAESNWMHKRMLALSERLSRTPLHGQGDALRELLHRSQANDAYWHGLFGGLYLPHLRRAVWNNLIALEAKLDALAPRAALSRADLDLDGHDEIQLHNGDIEIALRLDGHATIHELGDYALCHNFGDTLTRRREPYYRRFNEAPQDQTSDGIASAHDRVSFKHEIHHSDLLADARMRSLFIDCIRNDEGHWRHIGNYSLVISNAPEQALGFEAAIDGGRLEKRVVLDGRRLTVAYRASAITSHELAVQINLALPSCDGFTGRYVYDDGSIAGGFGQELDADSLSRVALEDGVLGGTLLVSVDRPVRFHATPCKTVSLSEAGFEKIMQAATITLSWPLNEAHHEVTIALDISSH